MKDPNYMKDSLDSELDSYMLESTSTTQNGEVTATEAAKETAAQ